MAKKFLSRKKKKTKAAASPLMADEPKPSSSSSSSRLNRDDEREARKKEREERRKKRESRINDAKESSSKSRKKKSKPKLSQEEQDVTDSQLGCWYKTQQFLVKMVHVLDALIGLTFVVYGSLINNKFENPAMEAVITTLTFGSTLLFTSIMGVIGFYSKMCSRGGLVLSGYSAPFIAFFYLLVIIVLLSAPDKISDYLTKYKDVLYLDDAEILTLKQILPFFYIVLASLAAIEIIRFMVLRNLRHTLVRYDAASERIFDSMVSSKKSNRSNSKRSSSKRSGSKRSGSSRSGSDRTNLTEPLMGDEEQGTVDSDDY